MKYSGSDYGNMIAGMTVVNNNLYLLAGGICSLIVSILHVAMIFGGPDWYRFFGAGEEFAAMAERGSLYPSFVTAGLAAVFGLWALYGFSGSGLIRRLPLLKPVIVCIGCCYLARGIMGIPVLFLVDSVYINELSNRIFFMLVTSSICLGVGFLYVRGYVIQRKR